MKKTFRWLLCIALVLCIAVIPTVLCACDNDDGEKKEEEKTVDVYDHDNGALYNEDWTPTHDKAVLFIPGLMASALYDTELTYPDGTPYCWWGADGFGKALGGLISQPGKKQFYLDGYMNLLTCDEDCIPENVYRIANMKDVQDYDAFKGMGYSANRFKQYFAANNIDDYDVLCWQYDWRQSIQGAGAKLEEFIEKCGYDKVMFVTHSMGGIVASEYLKKAENRAKVELFLPFSAPFLGSMDAVTNLFSSVSSGQDIIGELLGVLGINLIDFTHNMASVYDLLPMDPFNSVTEYFGTDGSCLTMDGEVYTPAQLRAFIKEKDWAKGSNGELKTVLADLDKFQSDFFQDDGNGNKVHVSRLVNTHYVVGHGIATIVTVNMDSENSAVIDKETSLWGDGTVPSYSASAGLPMTASNVHVVEGVEHGPIANEVNGTVTGLVYIEGILDEFFNK